MRIGEGSDIHKLASGYPLMLGGIEIKSEVGEIAHSDGDVLIHALIDALLGATATGDIGSLFPSNDDKWLNADSMELLKITLKKIHYKKIINIDSTIFLEQPKLAAYITQIQANLADLLKIDVKQVSVKAKTAEKLGSIGNNTAVAAHVVVLLEE